MKRFQALLRPFALNLERVRRWYENKAARDRRML
jgi:hypothetical protein